MSISLHLVRMRRNTDTFYAVYGIAFDGKGEWSFGNEYARNVAIFDIGNSSSSHTHSLKNTFYSVR